MKGTNLISMGMMMSASEEGADLEIPPELLTGNLYDPLAELGWEVE